MMARRSLSTIILVGALLIGAWSNVIAAAFCPRFGSNRACSIEEVTRRSKPVLQQSSCHHEMVGMEMDDMEMEPETSPDSNSDASTQTSQHDVSFESATAQVALDLPIEQCPHCWSHSQPTSGSSTISAIEPAKRLVETNTPPPNFEFIPSAVFLIALRLSRHGPPGITLPRHVLINVFRI
jgi:hypothetical protein